MGRAACTLRKPKRRALQVSTDEEAVAVKFAKNMQRLSYRASRKWLPVSKRWKPDPKGTDVYNPLRMVPMGVNEGLHAIMTKRSHMLRGCTHNIYNVDPHIIWTFQPTLWLRNLLRVIRHYNAALKRPANNHVLTCIDWKGHLVIWNGNHRIAASILLGRKVPVVRVIDAVKLLAKPLTPKSRTVKVRAKKKKVKA
jgi:hypothetical protein